MATDRGHAEVVDLLIAAGADIRAKTKVSKRIKAIALYMTSLDLITI
jgi:hypothetical protein